MPDDMQLLGQCPACGAEILQAAARPRRDRPQQGYTFRGLDYGIKSGILTAEAANQCASDGQWQKFGQRYNHRLEDSYVIQEMKQHRRLPAFLDNEWLYSAYPEMMALTLEAMYSLGADGQGLTWRHAYGAFRRSDAGVFDLARDDWRALRSR